VVTRCKTTFSDATLSALLNIALETFLALLSYSSFAYSTGVAEKVCHYQEPSLNLLKPSGMLDFSSISSKI